MAGPSEPSRRVLSVLVADSSQTQSQLMCSALRRQPGLRVTNCEAELSESLKKLKSTPADIVLISDGKAELDYKYELLRGLHAAYPRIGLILYLDQYDRDLVVNALRCGARGIFCSSDQPFKSLCRCIYAVHHGQIWANNKQIQYVLDALATASTMHVVNAKGEGVLTAREDQVVSLVAEGISNREIAEQLSIKENTVKKSLLRIYDKLGVSNRVELVLYALTHRERYHNRATNLPATGMGETRSDTGDLGTFDGKYNAN